MNVGTIVVVVVLVMLVLYAVGIYNGLIAGRHRF